jgi:hypothetical protein
MNAERLTEHLQIQCQPLPTHELSGQISDRRLVFHRCDNRIRYTQHQRLCRLQFQFPAEVQIDPQY